MKNLANFSEASVGFKHHHDTFRRRVVYNEFLEVGRKGQLESCLCGARMSLLSSCRVFRTLVWRKQLQNVNCLRLTGKIDLFTWYLDGLI